MLMFPDFSRPASSPTELLFAQALAHWRFTRRHKIDGEMVASVVGCNLVVCGKDFQATGTVLVVYVGKTEAVLLVDGHGQQELFRVRLFLGCYFMPNTGFILFLFVCCLF